MITFFSFKQNWTIRKIFELFKRTERSETTTSVFGQKVFVCKYKQLNTIINLRKFGGGDPGLTDAADSEAVGARAAGDPAAVGAFCRCEASAVVPGGCGAALVLELDDGEERQNCEEEDDHSRSSRSAPEEAPRMIYLQRPFLSTVTLLVYRLSWSNRSCSGNVFGGGGGLFSGRFRFGWTKVTDPSSLAWRRNENQC